MMKRHLSTVLDRKNVASYDGPLNCVISKPARPWGAL